MGCASSKRIQAATDVYRRPPSSFGVFDINAIEEPWLKALEAQQQQQQSDHPEEKEKSTHAVPLPLLEKLNAIEDAPRSWDEVSKALNDLKPTLHSNSTPYPTHPKPILVLAAPKTPGDPSPSPPAHPPNEKENAPGKSFSFHTLEELDAKLSSKSKPDVGDHLLIPKKTTAPTTKPAVESKKHESTKHHQSSVTTKQEAPAGYSHKPVKENIFILRDKLEREKEGKVLNVARFNPLNDFPEMCLPGGEDSVVVYTTSLGGVRRTFEDCNKVRLILESHRFVFDERDVSLHGEFLKELREMVGEGVSVPRMFVKGRYVGGVDEVVKLNETGRLGRILNWARIERGVGRLGCEGCGGARFVPCLDCGGSCKILVGDDKNEKERCPSCNENGLVLCPACA